MNSFYIASTINVSIYFLSNQTKPKAEKRKEKSEPGLDARRLGRRVAGGSQPASRAATESSRRCRRWCTCSDPPRPVSSRLPSFSSPFSLNPNTTQLHRDTDFPFTSLLFFFLYDRLLLIYQKRIVKWGTRRKKGLYLYNDNQ